MKMCSDKNSSFLKLGSNIKFSGTEIGKYVNESDLIGNLVVKKLLFVTGSGGHTSTNAQTAELIFGVALLLTLKTFSTLSIASHE